MKLVKIVEEERVAKLLADPMRRAILNILRERPMSEAQLARKLGLTDASVSYHLGILRKAKLLLVESTSLEDHGISQKFYIPSAYLYLPDTARLPLGAARYYLPINIERVRGALSSMSHDGYQGSHVDEMGEDLSKALVEVARSHLKEEVEPGMGEQQVIAIYRKACDMLSDSMKKT